MLVAFRLFLFAAGLVVLALVVTARGLVPEPDVRTRIGEVPSVGRSLVQQAIVPPAMIGRQSSGAEGKRAETPTATSGRMWRPRLRLGGLLRGTATSRPPRQSHGLRPSRARRTSSP